MKQLLVLILGSLLGSFGHAQSYDSVRIEQLDRQNKALQEQLTKLEQRTQELTIQVASNSERVAQLSNTTEQKVGKLHEQIVAVDDHYGLMMDSTGAALRNTDTRQHRSVVWGIVIAVAICLLLVATFLILRKRIAKKGVDIELLRARADDLNRQMVERMDKELAELQKIVSSISAPSTSAAPNHDIVLAVGDNLAIMESNLYRMDAKTPGYKTLTKAVEKMKNNLLQKGYDFVNMLGTEYVDGMNVDKVVFKDDENIEEGKQIITAVRRPQINYNGTAIQLANIEVSQNI